MWDVKMSATRCHTLSHAVSVVNIDNTDMPPSQACYDNWACTHKYSRTSTIQTFSVEANSPDSGMSGNWKCGFGEPTEQSPLCIDSRAMETVSNVRLDLKQFSNGIWKSIRFSFMQLRLIVLSQLNILSHLALLLTLKLSNTSIKCCTASWLVTRTSTLASSLLSLEEPFSGGQRFVGFIEISG